MDEIDEVDYEQDMPSDEDIEQTIEDLEKANKYSTEYFGLYPLGVLVSDLRSGDKKKVLNALHRAKRALAEYRADLNKGHGM